MIQNKEVTRFVVVTGIGVLLIIAGGLLFASGAVQDSAADLESDMAFRWARVVGFPIGVGLVGVGLCLWALVGGLKFAYGRDDKAQVRVVRGAYIIAAFIESREGRVFDPEMFAPEDLTYYVHVHLGPGEKAELKTSRAVFDTIGEGLKGTVTFQGKWLGKFEREILAPEDQPRSYIP